MGDSKKKMPVSISSAFKIDKTEYYEMILNSVISGKPGAQPESKSSGDGEDMEKARRETTDNSI